MLGKTHCAIKNTAWLGIKTVWRPSLQNASEWWWDIKFINKKKHRKINAELLDNKIALTSEFLFLIFNFGVKFQYPGLCSYNWFALTWKGKSGDILYFLWDWEFILSTLEQTVSCKQEIFETLICLWAYLILSSMNIKFMCLRCWKLATVDFFFN